MRDSLIHNNILTWSFLLLFAVLPFLEILSPIVLAILIGAGLFLKSRNGIIQKLIMHKALWVVASLFILAVISLLYTSDTDATIGKIGRQVAFFLIPLAFILVNPGKQLIEKAKQVFIFACVALCIISLGMLIYNYIVNQDQSHWYNFVQTSMGRDYMPEDAMFLNTALVLLLFGNFKNLHKFLISLLFLSVIILFGVRLGLFLNLLVLGVFIIVNIKVFFNIKSLLLLLLVFVVGVALIHQNSYTKDKFYDTLGKIGVNTEQVSEIGEDYHNISLRAQMWNSALDLICEKPLLGHGAGVEKKELRKVYESKRYDISSLNAHNQFLSLAIQYGLIGVVLLLFLFYVLFRKVYLMKSLPWLLVCIIMLVSMLTESYLEIQRGVFYFCIFASILIIEPSKTKPLEN